MSADHQPADVPLAVTVERPRPTLAVLHAAGEVDAATLPALRSGLDAAVEDPARDLVLDLAGVQFMGSSGLSMLVEARRVTAARGGTLRLAAPPRAVLRPLELSGLLELFTVCSDTATAVSDL